MFAHCWKGRRKRAEIPTRLNIKPVGLNLQSAVILRELNHCKDFLHFCTSEQERTHSMRVWPGFVDEAPRGVGSLVIHL